MVKISIVGKLKDFCHKCIQKLHKEFEKMGLLFENKFEM